MRLVAPFPWHSRLEAELQLELGGRLGCAFGSLMVPYDYLILIICVLYIFHWPIVFPGLLLHRWLIVLPRSRLFLFLNLTVSFCGSVMRMHDAIHHVTSDLSQIYHSRILPNEKVCMVCVG